MNVMRPWPLDRADPALGLERAASMVAELLIELDDTRAVIPDSEWSTGDAAAHIAMAIWFYGEPDARRDGGYLPEP